MNHAWGPGYYAAGGYMTGAEAPPGYLADLGSVVRSTRRASGPASLMIARCTTPASASTGSTGAAARPTSGTWSAEWICRWATGRRCGGVSATGASWWEQRAEWWPHVRETWTYPPTITDREPTRTSRKWTATTSTST